MRILITGAGGFVGGYLTQHLLDSTPTAEIHGTTIETQNTNTQPRITWHSLDLREYAAVRNLIETVRPEQLYHLAAQAFVPRSFEAPWETLENNILGQLNLILACLESSLRPRTVIVSSAEIYGPVKPERLPIDESCPLCPTSPYSVSKITQDMLGLQYFLSHDFPIMRARPFNHIGPGQNTRFVAADFAMQIARIEQRQQEPILYVGDLSAKRDFTDVRDIVRAYRLIMEKGAAGQAYNIASGKAYSIRELLDILLQHSTGKIEVRVAADRIRPTEIPILCGNAARLRTTTGWQPVYTFEQTLLDVLNYYREQIQQEGTPL